MADTEVAPPARVDRFIIRSWPKIILMLPTLFMALLCGGIMSFKAAPAVDAGFGWLHFVGLMFLFVLMINLTLLLYDLSLRGFLIIALGILAFVLGIFLLNQYVQGGVWRSIGEAFSIRVYANAAFYFTFAFVLFFNLAIAWIQTRFHFWVIERNEIIIHRGYMAEQERHPTAQTRFKLVIDDVVEYGLLRSGKLVFIFGDDHSEHVLDTVLCVHGKAKVLDDLLGRMAVTQQ